MSIFEAIIQGIVQGATEFLPVSSSGHLSLAQHIMGVKVDSLLFDILLHLGTLIAVCAVYYKLIWRLIKAFISLVADVFRGKFKWKEMDHDRRLLMMLMIGLIPLFLLFLPVPGTGMKLKDISELWASDSTIWIEGFALLMTSALLFLGIRASKGAKVHHCHAVRGGGVPGPFPFRLHHGGRSSARHQSAGSARLFLRARHPVHFGGSCAYH